MLANNRAIDWGCGFTHCSSVGLKAAFTTTEDLRPVNDSPLVYHANLQKPKRYPATDPNCRRHRWRSPESSMTLVRPPSHRSVGRPGRPLWDQWVSRHHYLGYQRLLGHRLKYLAFLKDRPVAALSWSAPALKIAARDRFIGWSAIQRKRHLHQVAGNSRFLIPPWVRIKNLASHVLALNIARLPADWLHHFNHRLLLLETFVDGRFFEGTCYKAANWLHVGHTYGSTKQGKGYRYHGHPKEVYLYVIDPDFRHIIDCQRQPAPVFDRSPRTQIKVEALVMLLEHCKWHPTSRPI
ncbi:MAG: DUF4338 domain-containing protein [Desulfobacterales bacterium]|nr:DUF4338 domain-containing protein [Desulfobacterales bacterium]